MRECIIELSSAAVPLPIVSEPLIAGRQGRSGEFERIRNLILDNERVWQVHHAQAGERQAGQPASIEVELVPVIASNRMQFLQQGRIDVMIATMSDGSVSKELNVGLNKRAHE